MGPQPTNLTFYAPIEKTDDEQRMVYGYASTEALDSQDQIVKKDAIKKALDDYMRFANIREMHQPSAVGKAKQANLDNKGLYLGAKVVDDAAWKKVKEGVYNGFSIGGRVMQMVDNEITDLKLSEISLVDRPANPDAVFDVWKMDDGETEKRDFSSSERKEMAGNGKAMPDGSFPIATEADLHNAIRLYGHATDKAAAKKHIIDRARAMGMASALPADWNVGKAAATDDLTKDDQPTEFTPAVAGTTEAPKDAPAGAVAIENPAPVVETTPAVEETPAAPIEDTPAPAEETPAPAEETPAPEVAPVVEEKAEEPVDIMKVAEDKVHAGQMPTDDELTEIMKLQDIEPNQQNLDAMKWHLAGKIIKFVEESIKAQTDKDAAIQELEAAKGEAVTEEVPHQFDEVKLLVKRLEKQLEKSRASEASVPPAAPVSPEAANESMSSELASLKQLVAILISSNQGNQLSPEEEALLRNGVSAGSERTSQGRFNEENKNTSREASSGATPQKAAGTHDLAKLEAELFAVKTELQKLASTPEPVKIKASYTIEKFQTDRTEAQRELEKAEKRADELHELMKSYPTNQDYVHEAQALAPRIMQLRRNAA